MKVHRVDAHYREASTSETCGNCESMNPDGSCDKVYGMVERTYVCDLWTARSKGA